LGALADSYPPESSCSAGEGAPLSNGINNAKIKIKIDNPNNLDEISVMTLRIKNTPDVASLIKTCSLIGDESWRNTKPSFMQSKFPR
jgi:hypothetical protein